MAEQFTHFDKAGAAIMVDVTEKRENAREAIASGTISVSEATMRAILEGTAGKGDVLGVARIAGIMGVKRTSDLIPLCHPLPIGKVHIDFVTDKDACTVTCTCTVRTVAQTGVEMEALTGVSTALLTVYDMCKAIDKHMTIGEIHLCNKEGGKSGTFIGDPAYAPEGTHD